MNSVYLYNGDFNSLLQLICKLISLKIIPLDIQDKDNYQINLFDKVISLNVSNINIKSFILRYDDSVIHTCYYVYLSSKKSKEMAIYYFLLYALKYHNKVYLYRKIKWINMAIEYSGNVSREAHKLKGFLRFKLLSNNLYYGVINPTNNVIEILVNHFKVRLKNESWLIYDENHKIYALYKDNNVYYLKENDIKKLNIDLDDNEINYENLWKTFFKSVAIRERKNVRNQMGFMPKKYWHNIIEMRENENSS